MRLNPKLKLCAAAAAGLAGFILRKIEYTTVLNGGVGIVEEGSAVSICLMALSAAAIVLAVLFAWDAGQIHLRDFVKCGMGYFGAGLILAGAVLYAVSLGGSMGKLEYALVLFAVLGAVGVFEMCRTAGTKNVITRVLCICPAIFGCIWLLMSYRANSTDPQLIKYAYDCLAQAAITMSFYYISGFYYGRNDTRFGKICAFLAIFFSMTALGDCGEIWQYMIYIGYILSISAFLNFMNECDKKSE